MAAKNQSGSKLLERLTKGAKKNDALNGNPKPRRGDAQHWRRVANQKTGA